MTAACILGCAGPALTEAEAAFFSDLRPWGFILFGRNIETPDQVRALVRDLRAAVDRPDAAVLIDQEGGRVQRLAPPHWRRYPAARDYGLLAADPPTRRGLARLGARLIAHDLASLGVNVDCAPVLDVPAPGAHDIIGDRAYAGRADEVAYLARAVAEGLIAGGVLPIIKHIPGHGRALADSHLRLPVVEASLAALEEQDFAPFRGLSDMPMAMTAHVVYAAIDARRPATTSPTVIETVIRGSIGFDGLLISDDLSMEALTGSLDDRAQAALAAGCDMVLHCNGDMAQMRAVAGVAPSLAGSAAARAAAALARLPKRVEAFDAVEAAARFGAAFKRQAAA